MRGGDGASLKTSSKQTQKAESDLTNVRRVQICQILKNKKQVCADVYVYEHA